MKNFYLFLHFFFGAFLVSSSIYLNYRIYILKKNDNFKENIKKISTFSDKTEILFIFFLPMLSILHLTTNQYLLSNLSLYVKFALYFFLVFVLMRSRFILKNNILNEDILRKREISYKKFFFLRQLYLLILFITFFYTPVNNGLIKTLIFFRMIKI